MLSPADIDWQAVKSKLLETVSGIRPVTYDELGTALEATHDISGLATGSLIEDAVSEGYLAVKEEGYVFPRGNVNQTTDTNSERQPIAPQCLETVDVVESDEILYPEQMRVRDNWVCWAGNKQPRAPWQGHMYPVQWAADLPEEELPTIKFEKAKKWQDRIDSVPLDCPDGVSPRELELGYLLPHDNGSITLIDLDDVRDPQTGEIHPVAREILRDAGSYAEISQSGAGVHIFVAGELPDTLGALVEPIDDEPFVGSEQPKVELYDHGRVVAMTGEHVRGTPTAVAHTQSVIDRIVDEYTDHNESTANIEEVIEAEISANADQGNAQSPYYDFDPKHLVTGSDWTTRGDRTRGPHPGHGSTTGNNCAITGDGQWYCFRHDVGGGGLQLLAVVEELLECSAAGTGGLEQLTETDFLKLCLIARDRYGQQGKPPYRALQAAASEADLIDDAEEQLGEMYEIARTVYDNLEPQEL